MKNKKSIHEILTDRDISYIDYMFEIKITLDNLYDVTEILYRHLTNMHNNYKWKVFLGLHKQPKEIFKKLVAYLDEKDKVEGTRNSNTINS